MSVVRPIHPHEPVWLSGYTQLDKLSPEFSSCGSAGQNAFECTPCVKSGASSTCHSDDSGIDGTVNLDPQSPLPEDTDDSEDSTSLDGYHMITSNGSSHQNVRSVFRPLTARLYHDMPQGVENIAETAQLSPSGSWCMAASRDPTCHPYETTTSSRPDDNRFQILSYHQLLRLNEILTQSLPIHSRCAGYPVIWARLSDLFQAVRENLRECGVPFRDMRLNGGAASYVIGMETSPTYNDIDILISVDLSSDPSAIQKVKAAVLDALMRFLPEDDQTIPFGTWSSPSTQLPPHVNRRVKYSSLSQSTVDSDKLSSGFESNPIPASQTKETVTSSNDSLPSSDSDSVPELLPKRLVAVGTTSGLSSISNSELASSPLSADSNPNTESVHGHTFSPLQPPLTSLSTGSFSLNVQGSSSPVQSLPPHSLSPNGSISLRESYIYKQFRKYGTHDADCWSLLSLGIPSSESKVVEFKFVDRMRRQFEFTVDSFQILLDPILSFIQTHSNTELTPNFYPTVVAESVAGSFSLALHHLKNKLILTKEPEMIRGGGLLKYCRLLVNGYQAPHGIDVCSLERYMSSRFFIDFQDLDSQKSKIEAFLANHFSDSETEQKIEFLKTVYRVVSGSTICLMSFERYQTLNLICGMLQQLTHHQLEARHRPSTLNLDWLTEQQNLVLDRIYLGTQLFPVFSRMRPYRYTCCQCEHVSTGPNGTGLSPLISSGSGLNLENHTSLESGCTPTTLTTVNHGSTMHRSMQEVESL